MSRPPPVDVVTHRRRFGPAARRGAAPMTTGATLATPALCFGAYRLDIVEARLTRDGTPVALRPKAFDLLATLAVRPNELVTKDELLDRVWGRRFITEGVIKSIVGELRSALGDDPKQPRWIETVPRRGYRFVGEVRHADATHAAVAPAATPAGAGNLPASRPEPIGRADALRSIAALHDAHRLVTVCGPSGVGKTCVALALAAARGARWRDGVWLVELATLSADATDVAALCATIARTLRLAATAGAGTDALATALRPLELLVVLDNAEHLVAAAAALVDALLAGTTTLRFVVTSQEPLHTPGEQVYRLAPLALPATAEDADEASMAASGAVQLFVQRVSGRLQGFALAPLQRHAVAAICRALDGMPLALELAAARVPLLGVHGIADLLVGEPGGVVPNDARLRLLTGGARTAAPRQRTLRNAIDWSYRLLDGPQQRVFRRLGVFSGGFSLATAQAVCAGDDIDAWFVLEAVDALVDKSLVDALDVGGARRFRLLESLRAFALERLDEVDEAQATGERHLDAALVYWKEADDRALDTPALAWADRHGVELDNLRVALRRADRDGRGDALADLVAHSAMLWCRLGLAAEGRAWCERARVVAGALPDPVARPGLALALATLSCYGNAYRPVDALPAARAAVAGHAALGDDVRRYYALYLEFQLQVRAPVAFDRAETLARMAALERREWGDLLKRFRRGAVGYDLRMSGDATGYLAYCRDEFARCGALGAVAEGWVAAQGLMLAEQDVGDADAAIAIADAAIDEIRAAGRLRQHPILVALRATMLAEAGRVARGRSALVESLPILRGIDSAWMAHVALAWLAAHDARDDDAARIVGWHAASLAAGRATSSGAYVARAFGRLEALLAKRLGVAEFARSREAGASLDDEQAERLGLGA